MPYYSDSDMDQLANDVYTRVLAQLNSDTGYARERERGRTGKLRRLVKDIIVDVMEYLFGRVVASIVNLVLGWILNA